MIHIFNHPPKKPRADRRRLARFKPRANLSGLACPRKLRRALGGIGLAAAATLLFASQAQAFNAVRHDPFKAKATAHDLSLAGGFALGFIGKGKPTGTIYDESIGLGVDDAGFANLPLNPGGTDGAELITAAPTSVTGNYDSGTRTLSRASLGVLSATWSGLLQPNTTYHLNMQYSVSSTGGGNIGFYVQDESGNIYTPNNVPPPTSGELDILFTTSASGTQFKLVSGTTMIGSVSGISVKANTGGLAGRRFFVDSATGDDTRDNIAAKNPATPLASTSAANAFVQPGRGDQVLVAEGSSFAGIALTSSYGKSLIYPTVTQSYDPADPLNEAKYGRATGENRPKFNTGGTLTFNWTAQNTGNVARFLALRGLDIAPPNIAEPIFNSLPSTTQAINAGFLIENAIFRYTAVNANWSGSPSLAPGIFIFRNCAFYGSWSVADKGGQGLYADSIRGLTIEDCVFYHCGWKIGASRGDDSSVGGLTKASGTQDIGLYRHPVYSQNNCPRMTYRRNLVIEGAADGGHILGAVVAEDNVIIDCPIGLDLTGGGSWNTVNPNGKDTQAHGNLIIGGNDISPVAPRGSGIWTENGSPGSAVNDNLLIRTTNISGYGRYAFHTESDFGLPSYVTVSGNVSYLRAVSGQSFVDSPGSGSIIATYNDNIWDDPTSGTNRNIGDVTFPNPYTDLELYAAAGFADRQAVIDDAIAHPEAHNWRKLRTLARAGYGMAA